MIILAALKLGKVPRGEKKLPFDHLQARFCPVGVHRVSEDGAIFATAFTLDLPRESSFLIYLASSAITLSTLIESKLSVKIPTTNSSWLCHLSQPSPQTNCALWIKTVKPKVVAANCIFFLVQQQSTGSHRVSGTALDVKKNRAALHIFAACTHCRVPQLRRPTDQN